MCMYRKLIILDMLNQIEEKEKYEQIKTKQSILFIYEAWHKVSEENTIQPKIDRYFSKK